MVGVGQPIRHRAGAMSQALPTLGSTIRSQRLVLGTPTKDRKSASASKRVTIICKPMGRLPKVGVGHPRGQALGRRAQTICQALPALGIAIGSQECVPGTPMKDEKGASASQRTTIMVGVGKPMGRLPKVGVGHGLRHPIGRRTRSMGQALPAPRGTTPNQKFAPTVLTIGKPHCKRQCESGQSKPRCEKTRPWTSPENQKRSDSEKVGILTEHGWIGST